MPGKGFHTGVAIKFQAMAELDAGDVVCSSPGRDPPRRFELAFELHQLVQFAVQHLRTSNQNMQRLFRLQHSKGQAMRIIDRFSAPHCILRELNAQAETLGRFQADR